MMPSASIRICDELSSCYLPSHVRSANRDTFVQPDNRLSGLGFRVARTDSVSP